MARDHPLRGGASQQVGRYQIQSHIASGGMGAVYLAFDPLLNRTVALKVLSPEMASKPNMVARFHREAKSAARLRHDHIVQIFDVGEANGTYFLALEFVDGTDLQDYIEQRPGGRLDIDEAIFVTIQAAKALDHAYAQGIVHRDIKPSNFLITTRSGKLFIKLTDMGLARTEDDSRITRDNTTLGTVDYISPEQARDSSAADTRSDLYSLGCSLYHMLVGHAPFPKGSLIEKVQHHLYTAPPDVRSSRSDVPDELADIIFKLLAKDPDERYETPLHLLHDLMTPAEFAKYRSDTQDLHPAHFVPPARHKRPVDATVSLSKIDELPPPDPLFPADYRTASTEPETEAVAPTRQDSRLHEAQPEAKQETKLETRQATQLEPDQPISVELTPEEPPPPPPAPAPAPPPAPTPVFVPEKAAPAPRVAAPVAEKPAARSTAPPPEKAAPARVERPAARPVEKQRPQHPQQQRPKTEPPAHPPHHPPAAPAPAAKKTPGKKRPVTPAAHERLRRREARRLWQSPLWLGGIAGGLLLIAFLTWAAMSLFSRPRLDPGPIEPVAVEPPTVVDPKKPKVDPPDPPKIDPKIDPKVDPPKVDPPKVDPPKIDPPPIDVRMGPPSPPLAPLAKAIDIAGLEREVLGPHAEIAAPAAGTKVLRVSRGVPPRGDTFAYFADAWREAGKLSAAIIEIDDLGPLPIPTLPAIAARDVTVRPAPGIRPILVWDIRPRETARNWMPLDSGKLLVEGVDLLVRDELLPADGEPLACFQVGGSAACRDVTLTQTGGPRPGVALVRIGGRPDAKSDAKSDAKGNGLVHIDRSYLRGRGVLAADIAAGGDLLVDNSLVLGKSRPSVLVSAPTSQVVNVRFHRSTLASSKAVVHASADAVAPRVCLFGLDSIFACPSPDEAGAFLTLSESVGVSGITSKIAHSAYAGWPTLMLGRQTRLASLAEWRKHWGHLDGDVVLDAPWPPLPPALDSAEAIEFSTLNSPLAIQSTREKCGIGCQVGKLPDMPPADRLRPAVPATLEFPAAGMPVIDPAEPDLYSGEILDLSKGNIDLGAYLATKKLAPRVVIHLAGRGAFPSSPLQIADTQLVLYATPDLPILDFKTMTGVPAVALVDVERGSLEMINVRIRLDWKRLPEMPASFVRARDASIHFTHCLVQTPLVKVPDGFHSLIELDGVAADQPAKFTCRDSVLLSGASVLTVNGPAALVRWRHNFALGMDDLISLAPFPAGKTGQVAGLFEYNTFAAQKAFVRYLTPANRGDGMRPTSIVSRDNHITSPTENGNTQMLRLEGNGVARGLVDWKSQGNAYDSTALQRPLAWGKDVAVAAFPQAWVDYWGAAAIAEPLIVAPKTNAKFSLEQPTLDRFILPNTLRVDLPGANFPPLVPLLYPPKKK